MVQQAYLVLHRLKQLLVYALLAVVVVYNAGQVLVLQQSLLFVYHLIGVSQPREDAVQVVRGIVSAQPLRTSSAVQRVDLSNIVLQGLFSRFLWISSISSSLLIFRMRVGL